MKPLKRSKIIIIANASFPIGLAGTSRILSYCKGFLYHGYHPEVLCIKPTESYNSTLNVSAQGIFHDVKYSYPGGITIRSNSFFKRRKNDLFSKLASIRFFFKIIKKGDIAFIIFYGNCLSVELSSILLSSLFKVKIYKEESENPEIYFHRKTSFLNSLQRWFFINKLYKLYSGIFVMTHPLKDFFLNKGNLESSILIVPQTVENARFENKSKQISISLPKPYIAYVGSINQLKDGVLTLVESFQYVNEKYPEIHLVLAGDGTSQEKEALLSLIIELHQTEKVHYIGRISSNEIPNLLNGAKLLVSCRPKSVQSDFGFPTKVVEYLATGNPIVTTANGDLAYYLKDRENAFIACNANPNSFGSKILEALDDYDFALKVSKNGKKMVFDKFNPILQTKKIIDFVKIK